LTPHDPARAVRDSQQYTRRVQTLEPTRLSARMTGPQYRNSRRDSCSVIVAPIADSSVDSCSRPVWASRQFDCSSVQRLLPFDPHRFSGQIRFHSHLQPVCRKLRNGVSETRRLRLSEPAPGGLFATGTAMLAQFGLHRSYAAMECHTVLLARVGLTPRQGRPIPPWARQHVPRGDFE
jgi:hypothetical protein